jgi:hypothetical protein
MFGWFLVIGLPILFARDWWMLAWCAVSAFLAAMLMWGGVLAGPDDALKRHDEDKL